MKRNDKGSSGGSFRRLAVLLLSLCMMLTMMPLAVFAEGPADGSGAEGSSPDADTASEESADAAAAGLGWADAIYVLGTQVTSENYDDILGDGTVSYDRSSMTLTLTDAVLDLSEFDGGTPGTYNYASALDISAWGGTVTIELEGSSRIISGSGTYAEDVEYVYGIEATTALKFTGGGSLDISIAASDRNIRKYFGIDSSRRISVEGGRLTVGLTGRVDSTGILTYDGIALSDGAYVGVRSEGGPAVYDGSYKKTDVGTGSCIEMVSDYGAFQASSISAALKEQDILVNTKATPDNASAWDKKTSLSDYKYVKITSTESGGRASGSVYILGRQIDDGTVPADQFPHDGTISYDSASNTLFLKDVYLNLDNFSNGNAGNLVVGIYAMSELNIVLSGDNTVISASNRFGSGTEHVSGIEGWKDISITGDADSSLSVILAQKSGSNNNITNRGIDCGGNLYVEGPMLSINTGSFGKCTGIYSWGPVIADRGAYVRVSADGSANKAVSGTNSIGNSEILDGSVLEMSSEGTAFDCWTPGDSLKSVSALVSSKASGAGAYEWDKRTKLYNYKYVKFSGDKPEASGEGDERFGDDVRILGTKIDESNCDDVFDDGTVSFDLETNTLTLNNASLDLDKFHHEYDDSPNPDSGCNYVAGVLADRNISVILKGKNRIYSSTDEYPAKRKFVFGLKSGTMTNMDISGPGSLDISFDKNSDAIQYYGIETGDRFSVDGAAVSVDLGGPVKGEGMDIGFNDLALENGASLRVKATGGASTGVYYTMASDMSMDGSSLLEMTADGKAFSCWMLSDAVKLLGAVVNTEPTADEASVWDGTTALTAYKYVRFPENYSHTHSPSHVDGKAATCKEDGHEEYWECSCGALFADEAGTQPIDKPAVIPATGEHSWDKGKVTRIATILHKGVKTYTCTVCSEKKEVEFTVRDAVKSAAEKLKEWIRNIFGTDDPDSLPSGLTVILSGTSFTYNGRVQKPAVSAVMAGDRVIDPEYYSIEYSDENSKDAGTYTVTAAVRAEGIEISGEAAYTIAPEGAGSDGGGAEKPEAEAAGEKNVSSNGTEADGSGGSEAKSGTGAVKQANPVSVSGKTASLRCRKLRKKAQTVKAAALMEVKDAQGSLSYELTGVKKAKYKKYFSIDPGTGDVRVKKKLKRGTYTLTVAVTASGNDGFEAAARTVICKVKVK